MCVIDVRDLYMNDGRTNGPKDGTELELENSVHLHARARGGGSLSCMQVLLPETVVLSLTDLPSQSQIGTVACVYTTLAP